MNKLKKEIREVIIEQVGCDPRARRSHDKDTGEILESYRAYVKFGFEVNAKNISEAREMILREATKFFNGILEVD